MRGGRALALVSLCAALFGCLAAAPPTGPASRPRPELPAGGDLRGADLRWADLRGATLAGARLDGADLLDADLRRADLRDASLFGAALEHADLRGADLRGAVLVGADLRQAALRGADLRAADLAGARLGWSDLREMRLEGARLERADLGHADLSGAALEGADLRHAQLQTADLRSPRGLSQAQLDQACPSASTRLAPPLFGGPRLPDTLPPGCLQREHRMAPANRGRERYSAWFGDSADGVFYLGLSPFWDQLHASNGDPAAELAEPGDHLIARFDLGARRFLEPLRVRGMEEGARGSVWDVLAHSSGRIFYTTFFQELGSVRADGSGVEQHMPGRSGWNELYEGPQGEVWVTRYAFRDAASDAELGSVMRLGSDGVSRAERVFPRDPGGLSAPKSLAVDPVRGEVWLNTDRFTDGEAAHETIRLTRDLRVLSRSSAAPELLFMTFDSAGRGWFAFDEQGRLVLELREGGRVRRRELGPRGAFDFLQDMKEAPDGRMVLTSWSGRVLIAELREGQLLLLELLFERPPQCRTPYRNALFYTAVLHGQSVFTSLSCDARVLELPVAAAIALD